MRILLVNWQDRDNPQAGGAEIHLFELFRRLAAWGHEVRLVCSGWAHAEPRVTIDGIEVERHGDRHTFAVLGRPAVKRAVAAFRPDVLVEDINKLPLFTAGLTRVPVCVLVPHLFGTTAFKEASWPIAAAVVAAEALMPWFYGGADFQVISESTRDDLVARGIPAARIVVIHPGIDAGHYTVSAGVDRTRPPAFLYVGRLRRYKGVEVALGALKEARMMRDDLTLDIAGTGDDRPRLEQLARGLGISAAVRFHGFVTEERKLELLRTTSANIFPSPKEGWGITVMEAAACGTPSLASDSPGLRDSVVDGVTGYLVPHGDAAALARRMLELANDAPLVERLGTQARAHAEHWSWEDAARATLDHLARIVGR